MLIQFFFNLKSLIGYYTQAEGLVRDEKRIKETISRDDLQTWSFDSNVYALNSSIEFLSLVFFERDLETHIPVSLEKDWKNINDRMQAHFRSFKLSKLNFSSFSLLDLIPQKDIEKWCYIKEEAMKSISPDLIVPRSYSFNVSLLRALNKISQQDLKIDKKPTFINYSIFGSKTGRLTLKEHSFPIHNLEKTKREVIKPQNSFLVELDYNAIDLRVFLALSDMKQPEIDPHQWNADNIFLGKSRKESKSLFFAWLYGSTDPEILKYSTKLEEIYKKKIVLDKFFLNEYNLVRNAFEREIETDSYHALSHIIQSTSNDVFLRALVRVGELLENKKSFIKLTMHDSILLDFDSRDGVQLMKEIIQTFKQTELGEIACSVKFGKNFGDMVKI